MDPLVSRPKLNVDLRIKETQITFDCEDEEDEVYFSARSNANHLAVPSITFPRSIDPSSSVSPLVSSPSCRTPQFTKVAIHRFSSYESDPGKPVTPIPYYVFSFDPDRQKKGIQIYDELSSPTMMLADSETLEADSPTYASICNLIDTQVDCDSDDSLDSWGTRWDSDSEDPGSDPESKHNPEVVIQAQETPEAKATKRCQLIMEELLSTEVEYVRRLAILTQAHKLWRGEVPTDKLDLVFRHLEPIDNLHRTKLLPELEVRIKDWTRNPRIGDILLVHAPYFKMYTEYITGLERATELVTEWETNANYMIHLHHLQVEMRKLKLSHLLKEPFPRIPRYRLLLEQYLKYLPDDSPDRQNVEGTLNIIHNVMDHFQKMMDCETSTAEMDRIQKKLKGSGVLLAASRHFVREGQAKVISAQSGKGTEHTLLLCSDLLLVCRSTIQGCRVRYKFNLQRPKVLEEGSRPDTFYLRSRKFCIEVGFKNVSEREDWEKVVTGLMNKRSKDCIRRMTCQSQALLDDDDDIRHLATAAPILAHFQSTSTCQGCGEAFSFVRMRKKYHCKCCGQVVCKECAPHKCRLAYNSFKERTVCNQCFVHLTDDRLELAQKLDTTWDEVKCSLGGVLETRTDDPGSVWQKRYCCVLSNHRLYCVDRYNKAIHVPLTTEPEILQKKESSGERVCVRIHSAFNTLYICLENRRSGGKQEPNGVKFFDGWTQWAFALMNAAKEWHRCQQKSSLSRQISNRSSSSSSDMKCRPVSNDEGIGSFESSVDLQDAILMDDPDDLFDIQTNSATFSRQESTRSATIEINKYYGCISKESSVEDIRQKFETAMDIPKANSDKLSKLNTI